MEIDETDDDIIKEMESFSCKFDILGMTISPVDCLCPLHFNSLTLSLSFISIINFRFFV